MTGHEIHRNEKSGRLDARFALPTYPRWEEVRRRVGPPENKHGSHRRTRAGTAS